MSSIRALVILSFLLLITHLQSHAQGSENTLLFNGFSHSVNLGDSVANSTRTIEMWFKPSTAITDTLLEARSLIVRDFDSGNGASTDEFGLFFSPVSFGAMNAGRLTFLRRIGSTSHQIHSDIQNWQADRWYHVAATIDTVNGMQLYINGMLQQSFDASTAPIGNQSGDPSDLVSIGKWGNLDIRFFGGEIDEVRIWTVPRSEQEIREKMCSKLDLNTVGLRAYYRLDDTAGSVVTDLTANGFDGQTMNMTDANWILSGAPIGDSSTFVYNNTAQLGQTLTYIAQVGDTFEVTTTVSLARGIHIYEVTAQPNSLQNLGTLPTGNYYGVFQSDIDNNFAIDYNYSAHPCSPCDAIFTRYRNNSGGWNLLNAAQNNCGFALQNQTMMQNHYRAEFIISTTPQVVDLGTDTAICIGDSIQLDATLNGAISYLWNDGNTDSIRTVFGPGTFDVLVDLGGCTARDTIVIDTLGLPTVALQNDSSICADSSFVLGFMGTNFDQILWSTGDTTATITADADSSYWIELQNGCGVARDTININLFPSPIVDLGPDTVICAGETLILNPITSDSVTYLWNDGSTDSILEVNEFGIYRVEVFNANCRAVDRIAVGIIDCNCTITMPNVFTPNADGFNDVFRPMNPEGCALSTLRIYNRWGQLLYIQESNQPSWSGRTTGGIEASAGTYFYVLSKADGESLTGTFDLLR